MTEKDETICLICKKPLEKDFVIEDYNGVKVWIHPQHPRPNMN